MRARRGGGGGGGARWKFYMMCAGSSEPSLVANSINTQISYAGSNCFCMCLQEVKWTIALLWGRERKKCCCFLYIIIIILFDTSVTFYASMFCDSGPNMHCRLCDSFFHLFLRTLVKMGSPNPPLLLVKRVGSRSGSTFCRSWQMVSAGDAVLCCILYVP